MDKVKVEFTGDGAGFFKETEKIKQSVGGLRNELLGSLKGAIFATFSIEALKKFNDEFKEFIEQIHIAEKQTGANANDLQVWQKQIQKLGGDMSDLTRIINKMAVARDKALEDPSGKEAKAFAGLGFNQSRLISTEAPQIFKELQEQISKTGSAVGVMGNLMDILGEKSIKSMAIFTDSFASQEEKMKKTGKLIESEIIDKYERIEKMNKGMNFADSILGGANNKAKAVGAVQEFMSHTMSAFQLIPLSISVVTDKVGLTKGSSDKRLKTIEDTQTQFELNGSESSIGGPVGGLSVAQYEELSAKQKGVLLEREAQLKRIAELREKFNQKDLTDEQKLLKAREDQLKLLKEMEQLAKAKDKTPYYSKVEEFMGNAPKVRDLQDKVNKEKDEKTKKEDHLVGEYMKKAKERYGTSYQMNDGLVNTGNFLGTSRARLEYLNIQTEQRDLLKSIDDNIRDFVKKNPKVDSVDELPVF